MTAPTPAPVPPAHPNAEPVLYFAFLVPAIIALAMRFKLHFSEGDVLAIWGALQAIGSVIARAKVSPTAEVKQP